MTYTDIAPVELESIGKDTEKVSLVKKPITMIGGDAIIKAINAPPKTMDKVEIQVTTFLIHVSRIQTSSWFVRESDIRVLYLWTLPHLYVVDIRHHLASD